MFICSNAWPFCTAAASAADGARSQPGDPKAKLAFCLRPSEKHPGSSRPDLFRPSTAPGVGDNGVDHRVEPGDDEILTDETPRPCFSHSSPNCALPRSRFLCAST